MSKYLFKKKTTSTNKQIRKLEFFGKKLSKKLELKFIDIDQIIEQEEKTTIKEIFKNKGETYFRRIEKKITLEELKKNNLVIALGGGAFTSTTIRREIKNSCISFWLDLSLKLLIRNLNHLVVVVFRSLYNVNYILECKFRACTYRKHKKLLIKI